MVVAAGVVAAVVAGTVVAGVALPVESVAHAKIFRRASRLGSKRPAII